MMELTIDGQVYQFNFGMGFLREANKIKNPNAKTTDKNYGSRFLISGVIDGDPETLVDVLDLANKGQDPRVTKAALDAYIDDPETNIDQLFEDTLDFLRKANATRKLVAKMEEAFAKLQEINQKIAEQ